MRRMGDSFITYLVIGGIAYFIYKEYLKSQALSNNSTNIGCPSGFFTGANSAGFPVCLPTGQRITLEPTI